MIDQNIQFAIKNDFGQEIDCFILASKCISDSELNIMYKYDDDEDNTIRYGKIFKRDNDYVLTGGISDYELEELKKMLDKEIQGLIVSVTTGEGKD